MAGKRLDVVRKCHLVSRLSVVLGILTFVTFVIAVATPPLSGPYCTGSCFTYPFDGIASRFPRDYYWMVPAILLSISHILLAASIHAATDDADSAYSLGSLCFALLSGAVLIVTTTRNWP